MLTSEYKINYFRPASGWKIVVRSTVVHVGKRHAVCRCDVLSMSEGGEEKLCATAQGIAPPDSEANRPSAGRLHLAFLLARVST